MPLINVKLKCQYQVVLLSAVTSKEQLRFIVICYFDGLWTILLYLSCRFSHTFIPIVQQNPLAV